MVRSLFGAAVLSCATIALSAGANAQLSAAAQLDLLKVEIGESLKAGRDAEFLERLKEFEAQGGTVDPEILYFKAEALSKQRRPVEALDAITTYINTLGSSGVRYTDALVLYRDLAPQAESQRLTEAREERVQALFATDTPVGEVVRFDAEYGYMVLQGEGLVGAAQLIVYDEAYDVIVPVGALEPNTTGTFSAIFSNPADAGFIQNGSSVYEVSAGREQDVAEILSERTNARIGIQLFSADHIDNRLTQLGWAAAKQNCFNRPGAVISVPDDGSGYNGNALQTWDLVTGVNGVEVGQPIDLMRYMLTHQKSEPLQIKGVRCSNRDTSAARPVEFETSIFALPD